MRDKDRSRKSLQTAAILPPGFPPLRKRRVFSNAFLFLPPDTKRKTTGAYADMIYDNIRNWRFYRFSQTLGKAFLFLENLPKDIADGEYEIDGRRIFANVMTYDTAPGPAPMLETHRRYVDIQFAIRGTEVLIATPCNALKTHTPYDAVRDAEFFHLPEDREPARLEMTPGMFAVFFPWDAHFGRLAPQMPPSSESAIRKTVIKADFSLFE